MRKTILGVLILIVCAAVVSQAADDTQLTAEQIVAKHLDAIGTADARAKAKVLQAVGDAKFQFLSAGGAGQGLGKMQLASEGSKMHLAIDLNTANYTGEEFVSDGSKLRIAGFAYGKQGILGGFVDQRQEVVKEGIFGGVLNEGWPLLDVDAHKAKIKFTGLKKIGDKDLLELKYEPKKTSGDIQIRFYFDPATYRHVMTVYEALIPVQQQASLNPNAMSAKNGANAQEGHQVLKEMFGNFKMLDGITIPSHWTIELTNDTGAATTTMRWDFNVQNAAHAPVDPAAFKVK